ncbi:MAG TPA: ATP-dependent DNA helicase RecG [Candidatus Dormibacteraeota bacterium]|nr:ATP-dependent DNA helicase RecG [Candidatus Dormibacteraeota bacterium]
MRVHSQEGRLTPTTAPQLQAPVTAVKSVTPAYGKKLERLGIITVADLLRYYPRRHDDFSQQTHVAWLKEGEKQTVRVRLERVNMRPGFNRKAVVEAYMSDVTGRMKGMWFNQPWLMNQLKVGEEITLSGKVTRQRGGGGLVMMNPAFETAAGASGLHTGRLVPMYRESQGITSKWLRKVIAEALPAAAGLRDGLPQETADRYDLPPLSEAVPGVHFPDSQEDLDRARRRIAFYQLLLMQIAVLASREERLRHVAPRITYDIERARAIRDAFPFTLTNAQRKAAHAIFSDMADPRPMARLLQGDVGSGKTAVAAMAIAMAAAGGFQALFMAPTELLAQQHARTLRPLLDRVGITMELLVGSTPASARRTVLAGLDSGFLDVVVGTHALIEDPVQARALGLVITDEQHRFGVVQRESLARKGRELYPHVLSMTATPIPRTLQLTLYGDLTVSVLDELPAGRQPVETRLILPNERESAYKFVRQQAQRGRQVFVICPLVEDSDLIEARSATSEYHRLQTDVFPDLRLALLHGRMKARDKDATMEAFRAGDFDVLVSTSVVEVGVDVPNATVMMIEGAERFGLAQLHQFRGRVGRGNDRAYCLLCSDADKPEDNKRLVALVRYPSGFDLAEVDLELRGPGDVLGATGQQSGRDDGLMVAGLLDARLISLAREEAERLIAGGIDRYPDVAVAAQGFHLPGSLS